MVKYSKSQNLIINDLEGGVNIDSDCEDNSTRAGGRALKGENCAVLITGSFSAYVHFLAPPSYLDK